MLEEAGERALNSSHDDGLERREWPNLAKENKQHQCVIEVEYAEDAGVLYARGETKAANEHKRVSVVAVIGIVQQFGKIEDPLPWLTPRLPRRGKRQGGKAWMHLGARLPANDGALHVKLQ